MPTRYIYIFGLGTVLISDSYGAESDFVVFNFSNLNYCYFERVLFDFRTDDSVENVTAPNLNFQKGCTAILM